MPEHPQRRRPIGAAGLCLAVAIALLAGSAHGAAPRRLPSRPGGAGPATPDRNPDFKLTVAAGLGGYCRVGWFPVHVTIEAGKEFEGHVVAALRLGPRRPILFETRRKVQLAANSKKDYHLYLRHESVHLGQGQVVDVYLDDGRPVPKTGVMQSIQLVPETKYLVCVVSDRRGLLGNITGNNKGKAMVNGSALAGGYSWEFKVAQPQLRSLPDRAAGYNGVDFLVLYQTPLEVSKLSTEKLDAIIDFARGGGVVLLSAGDRAWFARPELRPLVKFKEVAVTPKAGTTTLLARLERRYGARFLGRSRNMTTLDFKAQGFAADPVKGLMVGPCGLGTAFVWRVNLQDPSVRQWSGMYNFWAELGLRQYPNKPREDGYSYGYNPENNPVSRALQRTEILNLAQERSVSALLVVFIVVLYLVLVGPVNYFVLRRLDMRALSIVTIPLLSAVFVLITFAVGYISRGVTTVGRRVTVASVYSGGTRAKSITSQSVFPAGSMLVDVGTDGHGLMCPLLRGQIGGQQQRTYATMNEEGFILERYPLNMWEMAHFEAVSTRSLGGSITLEALTGNEGRTDGRYRLINRSAVKLEDAFVVSGRAGGKYAWIGDVERGKTYTGKVARWQQTSERQSVRRSTRAPSLTMRNALMLWIRKELGGKTSYTIVRQDDSFAEQAAAVMLKDVRLDPARVTVRTGMTLSARVRNADEFEPIKLDGGSVRGEAVNTLVVFSERGGSQ